jgi:hypothetical protein
MTDVLLRVDDSALDQFLDFIALCPKVEVLSTGAVVETKSLQDKCFLEAIMELCQDKTFRTMGDYGYIMLAVNDEAIKGPFFYSPSDFIKYLKELGLDRLPGVTTLYGTQKKLSGRYPNWTFTDHPDSKEKLRRNNVVVRFVSAYNRTMRKLAEGNRKDFS